MSFLITAPQTSLWHVHEFEEPVSTERLALIYHGFFDWRASGWSLQSGMTTESQLLLEGHEEDNGAAIVLDDAFSPSRGAPRPGFTNVRHGKLLSDSDREEIDGRLIVGWRWRAHAVGSGTYTVISGGLTDFLFSYEFADCNANGTPDDYDIQSGATDCDGNRVPDECDIADGNLNDFNGDGVADECDSPFLRADCNADASVDISDAVCILTWLFLAGDTPGCVAATNVDGSGEVEITDPIYLLTHLFLGGPAPAAPWPGCGVSDLEADRELGCVTPPKQCQQ